jgi:hypothetical protein
MPYFPPGPKNLTLYADGYYDGYITVFDSETWGAESAIIDLISVRTVCDDWDLYLCTDGVFDTNDPGTMKLVSNGLGDTIIPLGVPYASADGYIYFIYVDNSGSHSIGFFISGRSL